MPTSNNTKRNYTSSSSIKSTSVPTVFPPLSSTINSTKSTPQSGGFMSSVIDGFATSIGMQAATRLFNNIFGPPTVNVVHQQLPQQSTTEITFDECNKLKELMNESFGGVKEEDKEKFKKCQSKYNL